MPLVTLAASSFSTTGTIAASSGTLTVADASGFAVDDYLVVEIGHEAGAGARGTVGVGGTWPDLAYATFVAMTADSTKPDGQYAYVVTSGSVYRSFGGLWTQENPSTQYYTASVIPRSLVGQITNKVGNVLTLDVAATVTATGATVYFDNWPVLDAVTSDPDDTEVVLPAGDFALSDMWWMQGKSGWHIHGTSKDDTRLFFPKGISAFALIDFSGAGSGNRVSDICVQGNALAQGYMIGWAPGGDQTAAQYHRGIIFNSQTDGVISDTKSIDVFQYGAGVSFCANSSIYRHDAVHTEGLLTYIQWQVGGADCTGGELVDCTVTSAKLTAGIEWFRSTDVFITSYVGVNASMSINTCNNWLISSPTVTMQAGKWVNNVAFHINNPMIIVSKAIGGIDITAGGTITGATLTAEGYSNASNDVVRGILVDDPVPGITIQGGSYTAPDYASPSTLPGPQGIIAGANVDGGNTTVLCFTSYGVIQSGTPTVNRANIGVTDGSISYSRAGSIFGGPGVVLAGNGLVTDPLAGICTTVAGSRQTVYLSYIPSLFGVTFLGGTNTNLTLSDGNLGVAPSSGALAMGIVSTAWKRQGKFYFEITRTDAGTLGERAGLAIEGADINLVTAGAVPISGLVGLTADSGKVMFQGYDGSAGLNLGTWAQGTVLCVAIDLDNGLFWARIDAGDWNNTVGADPATFTGGLVVSYLWQTRVAPMMAFNVGSFPATAKENYNFGASTFAQGVPSGYAPGWTEGAEAALGHTVWGRWVTTFGTTGAGAYIELGELLYAVAATTGGTNGCHVGTSNFKADQSGKFYFEYHIANTSSTGDTFGIMTSGATIGNVTAATPLNCACVNVNTGNIFSNNANSGSSVGNLFGALLGVAVDRDNRKIWFRANSGGWNNGIISAQNPATNTGGVSISSFNASDMGPYTAAANAVAAHRTIANFGQHTFRDPAPSGFAAGWTL